MVLIDTSHVTQTNFQGSVESSASSSKWNGRSVSFGVLPTALMTVAALSVLIVGANAYGSWIERECDYNIWGEYVCWNKICHYEKSYDYFSGSSLIEKVCTHFI